MGNEALRRALADARLRDVDVASRLGVDPKTVRRWIDGRVPLLRHRWALADLVRQNEGDLWPDAPRSPKREGASGEVVATYPHRHTVPRDVWRKLFESAVGQIGILAYNDMSVAQDAAIMSTLADKAYKGVRVRVLLGRPEDPLVAQCSTAREPSRAMAEETREAIAAYQGLSEAPNAEVRLHRTVLYTSMCRADDELLVIPHVYGIPAAYAPVLHLRRSLGAHMVANYLDTFDRIWNEAAPLS